MALALWQGEFCHYRPLIERILAQTERRVLGGEAVPACEKIVSANVRNLSTPARRWTELERWEWVEGGQSLSGDILCPVFMLVDIQRIISSLGKAQPSGPSILYNSARCR